MLQYVALCHVMLQYVPVRVIVCWRVLRNRCVAVSCSVLHCASFCFSVLCFSVLQAVALLLQLLLHRCVFHVHMWECRCIFVSFAPKYVLHCVVACCSAL